MARWLIKTEPSDYAFDDLESAGRTTWDGVKNATALIHMRRVEKGDEVLVYHTGRERQAVGIARVVVSAHPDPNLDDERYVVFELEPVRRLERPVTLKEIKADPAFADFDLVRISRLSVMPVAAPLWRRLLQMSAED